MTVPDERRESEAGLTCPSMKMLKPPSLTPGVFIQTATTEERGDLSAPGRSGPDTVIQREREETHCPA